MIFKEWNADGARPADYLSAAGANAEKQMAHYLKREFSDQKDILVFNSLRFVDDNDDEAAQIDHLILHKRGIIIIETKNVKEIEVDSRKNWTIKKYDNEIEGIKSPVLQAKRQGQLLKKLLNRNRNILRNKVFPTKVHGSFNNCPVDILVAIGDKGIIKGNAPEVFKSDEIPGEVLKIIKRHQRADLGLSFSLKDGMEKFKKDEQERISTFLLDMHTPLVPKKSTCHQSYSTVSATRQVSKKECTPTHKGCSVHQVKIEYRRPSYSFVCQGCGMSFEIDKTCPSCGKDLRIYKTGDSFLKKCKQCGYQEVFHTNR